MPSHNPVMLSLFVGIGLVDQINEYGEYPPETLAVTCPVQFEGLQSVESTENEMFNGAAPGGSIIVSI